MALWLDGDIVVLAEVLAYHADRPDPPHDPSEVEVAPHLLGDVVVVGLEVLVVVVGEARLDEVVALLEVELLELRLVVVAFFEPEDLRVLLLLIVVLNDPASLLRVEDL